MLIDVCCDDDEGIGDDEMRREQYKRSCKWSLEEVDVLMGEVVYGTVEVYCVLRI
jgi:hypothetical protein